MKARALLAGLLASLWATIAIAGPISGYPAASALTGTEKIIATQSDATVNITPNQIATFIAAGNVATATQLATPRTLAITGDLAWISPAFDGSANVTAASALATVNANVGGFGDGTHVAAFTVNGKGLVTAASSVAITNTGTVTSVTCGAGLSGGTFSTSGTCALTTPVTVALGGTNATSASGTALDNISGFSSTGFVTRTGAGTYAFQSATNGVTLGNLAQSAANTMLGNWTSGAANVSANAMPSCSTSASALKYTTSTGIGCNSAIDAATLGGSSKGTSGATIPLLNGANTWSTTQTLTLAPVFTDQSGSRTALGLGTSATVNTGTSGATIPLLNAGNSWSLIQHYGDTSNGQITIDGAAGTGRSVSFTTGAIGAGVNRWQFNADNTAEGGANAGSNFALNSFTDAGALLSQVITINRVSGVVNMTNGEAVGGRLLCSATAPTISSGFGTSPSIVASNGTCSFQINVGTGGSATSGVIGLPTATTGWVCAVTDITTESTTVFFTKQTASSTTTATVGNFNTSAAAAAWVASDKLNVSCHGY